MKQSDQEQLVSLIRARINQLDALLKSTTNAREKLSEQKEDEESRSNAVAQATVDETVLAQAKKELALLRANLERLDQGRGGECEECGGVIPLARLLAVPTARLCVDCASHHEHDN